MLFKFRSWLILMLAGRMTVVINAEVKNGGFYLDGSRTALFSNVTFLAESTGFKFNTHTWSQP